MARQKASSMVPIRVDRLRAARDLDGRSWPEVARALGTTHQRLYHLTTADGSAQRRCRQGIRDGFARLFAVPAEWLSGQTDALPYAISADATIVAVPFSPDEGEGERQVHARPSAFRGAGRAVPGLQLALDRLLAKADSALARDEAQVEFGDESVSVGFMRPYGLFLVAASAEVGFDLIRPLPPIDEADGLRTSAVRHTEEVLRPWFEGKGPYPDWERIHKRILDQATEDERRTVLRVLADLGREDLFRAYSWLRGEKHKP
jgi:hypothetical protein